MKQTKYIGLDAHSSTCTFCVTSSTGVELDMTTLTTNGRMLHDYLKGIEGKKILTFEECDLSSWLSTILKESVHKIIVCNPVFNKQYKRAKTDKLDARNLAGLLRGGFLREVYHDGSCQEDLRILVSSYQDVINNIVGLKNRYKALYRRSNVRVNKMNIYTDDQYYKKLPKKNLRFAAKNTLDHLNILEKIRQEYAEEITSQLKSFPESKYLKSIPGIKNIQAAKIIAQVIEPRRFKNKHQFYSYCGLVKHQQISANRCYGSRRAWGNRMLKCVYKMAAQSAVKGNSALRTYYDSLRAKGASDKNPRNAVARKIAAISLSLWRNHKKYDDSMINSIA